MYQRKKIDGVKLYFEWIPALKFLPDEDKGKLLYYAMCYASSNYKAEFFQQEQRMSAVLAQRRAHKAHQRQRCASPCMGSI